MALDLSSSQLYFNRELSWLQFNSRVLAQALDEQHPHLNVSSFLLSTEQTLMNFI